MVWDEARQTRTFSVNKHKLTKDCFMKSKEMNQDRTAAPFFDMPFSGYNEQEFRALMEKIKASMTAKELTDRNDTT